MRHVYIIMTLSCDNLVQEWLDERLTWDPDDYDNIQDIVIHAHRIWTPELALINGSLDFFHHFYVFLCLMFVA